MARIRDGAWYASVWFLDPGTHKFPRTPRPLKQRLNEGNLYNKIEEFADFEEPWNASMAQLAVLAQEAKHSFTGGV